jgi:hypothetical protein
MSTRVVSFRITESVYDKMMVECYQKGIGCAEWVQQKITFSNYVGFRDQKIIEQLKYVRRKLKYSEDKQSGINKLDDIIQSLIYNYSILE